MYWKVITRFEKRVLAHILGPMMILGPTLLGTGTFMITEKYLAGVIMGLGFFLCLLAVRWHLVGLARMVEDVEKKLKENQTTP